MKTWLSVIAVAVVLAVFGSMRACDMGSYLTTAAGELRDRAKEMVSVEFELKRARHLVDGLDRAIRASAQAVVRNDVAIERLARQVEQSEKKLAASKARILQLAEDLKKESASYVYAGQSYSPDELRDELKFRFQRHRELERTTADLREVLNQLRKKRIANQRRFRELSATKVRLAAEIEGLDARLSALRAAQATGEVPSADSDVARVRKLLDELHVRIRVDESTADLVQGEQERLQIDSSDDPVDIVGAVEEHFARKED